MTITEENKIASAISVYFTSIQSNEDVEQTANAGLDLVKMLLEDFTQIDEKVDHVLSLDPNNWDALITYIKLKKI